MDRHARVLRLPARGREDPRAHPPQALARGAVGHPDPQGQAADHGRHLHRPAGDRDRQVGRRGGCAPPRAPRDHEEERSHQHQRDQAPRARREARCAVDRRAAPEPGELPPRDEALARVRDALGRAGHQDHRGRQARRRRDEPARDVLRGPCAAAHDPRGHRLRLRRGADDLRRHRREGLGQQGRDHAGGLRGRQQRARRPPRRPGSGTATPRRVGRGPRRLARARRSERGPRGPRHRPPQAAWPASRRTRSASGPGRAGGPRAERGGRRDRGDAGRGTAGRAGDAGACGARRRGRDPETTEVAPEATPEAAPENGDAA